MNMVGLGASCVVILQKKSGLDVRIFTNYIKGQQHSLLYDAKDRIGDYLGIDILMKIDHTSTYWWLDELRIAVFTCINTDTYIRSELRDCASKPVVIYKGKRLHERIRFWKSLKQRKVIKCWK
jgi:hypothetical protein